EMQLRTALGASTRQVLEQTTVESALLVGLGGTLGVVLAIAALEVLPRATSLPLARVGDLHVGWPAIAFATAVCAVIAFVFGAVGLLHLRRRDVLDGLRPNAGVTAERRAAYVQRVALATQVALVIVLAGAARVLLRSLEALFAVDPGFNPSGVMDIRVEPAG